MVMATQWYVSIDGDRRGPCSGEELQAMADDGRLAPRDLVWCEGMPDWVPAKNVLMMDRPEPARRRRRYDEADDDYDEVPVGKSRSQFPGKLVSPGFFLFAVFMFLLPWVDVRCNG